MSEALFKPPAGFDDLITECDGIGERAIGVHNVTLWTAPVTARDIGQLARCLRPDGDAQGRDVAMRDFLADHLDVDSYERVLENLMRTWSIEDLGQVMRAVCLRDTARPWKAFASLAVTTAREWRTVRGRLLAAGVTQPLALPSIHQLIDYVEWIVTENLDDEARAEYHTRVYMPEIGKVPDGWSPQEQLASFDALFDAMGSMR